MDVPFPSRRYRFLPHIERPSVPMDKTLTHGYPDTYTKATKKLFYDPKSEPTLFEWGCLRLCNGCYFLQMKKWWILVGPTAYKQIRQSGVKRRRQNAESGFYFLFILVTTRNHSPCDITHSQRSQRTTPAHRVSYAFISTHSVARPLNTTHAHTWLTQLLAYVYLMFTAVSK